MPKRLQRGAVNPTHSLWLRAVATLCLVFAAWAGTVEAVHIHGDWLPHQAALYGAPADGSQVPGGEEHCPLCVAMHSTLPVAAIVALVVLMLVECKPVTAVDHLPAAQWHFANFSRPPPIAS